MKNKITGCVMVVLLLCCKLVSAQAGQAIVKHHFPGSDIPLYAPAISFILKEGDSKALKLVTTFRNNDSTGKPSAFKGFDLFTLGMGKCFSNDTLSIETQAGKKLTLVSVNPDLCGQVVSGWYVVGAEDFAALFSSPLRKISFRNRKTGETISQEVISPEEQTYFMDLKAIFDRNEVRELN